MFEGFDQEQFEAEARERWGHTDVYAESTRRTARYGEEQWRAIRAEAEAIVHELARLLRDGEPATGAKARAAAERHRRHIAHWFYACSPDMHRALGEMYVSDERFTAGYERIASGLAAYVRDAIGANAGAQAR